MKSLTKQIILVSFAVIIIALIPLILVPRTQGEEAEIFEGADGHAEEMISEVSPDYEPWYEPFWEPPSGEIESLLFSLQVALGAIFIGYVVGTLNERKKHKTGSST
ncbi:MAG: energy-coupling factor ABC transporter substrate-binding protein [Treponemataceae bacterium]